MIKVIIAWAFFFLFITTISSCREKENGFLSLDKATEFSSHASISASEAYALLEGHLSTEQRFACHFRLCFIKNNEYYFLRNKNKTGNLDGYVVNARTGQIKRVFKQKGVVYPYSFEEQESKLFTKKRQQ